MTVTEICMSWRMTAAPNDGSQIQTMKNMYPDMEITIGRQTNTNFRLITNYLVCQRWRYFVDKYSEPVCCFYVWAEHEKRKIFNMCLISLSQNQNIYYWNKVTVHHLKLCYFLMKKDNTMICGVLLNHCLTVNRIISKSVCLDTRLRDTSLKRCGVKSQFTNSVSCVSIIGVDASLTTTTHASQNCDAKKICIAK